MTVQAGAYLEGMGEARDRASAKARQLARRFDRMATDAQRMATETSEPDIKQYFEGKREAYTSAAYLLRQALA